MSFSEDIRSSGNFQELFGKLRRRVNKTEVQKPEIDQLQDNVNEMKFQIDWARLIHTTDNLATNPIGPNDLVAEPDISTVMLYNPFANIFGDGIKVDKTLNGTDYDVINIGDSTFVESPISVTAGTYHYEPYRTFNGKTDFIQQNDAAALDLTQFSIACWFRTGNNYSGAENAGTIGGVLLTKGALGWDFAGRNMNYGLWLTGDDDFVDSNFLEGGFEEADGTNHIADSTTDVHDNEWHHGVVTYDGANVRTYLDGAALGVHATAATPDTGTDPIRIGCSANQFTDFFAGDIDEVRVWNNDLTAGEVSALHSAGTVPQTSAIVYQNTFGGSSGFTTGTKKCYYASVAGFGIENWDWNVGFHPPSMKNENSLSLNVGDTSNQFLYYDDFGTDFDFTANNISFGFWVYPTTLTNTANTLLMGRRVDANNSITIEIDADADNKLFGEYKVAGATSKRQFDTALTLNTWHYVSGTCAFAGPTLSLKVNDNADTASTKTIQNAPFDAKLYFGNHPAATDESDFQGYLAFPMWWKGVLLTTAQRTDLFQVNTATDTTEPAIAGFAQVG